MFLCHVLRRPAAVLAIAVSLLLSGCGGASDADLAKAKAAGASEQAAQQKEKTQRDDQAKLVAEVKKLQNDAAAAKKQAATAAAAAATKAATAATQAQGTSCGNNLSVGTNTSCAFAQQVETSYYSWGAGTNFTVWSPVTSQWYTMNCTAGLPIVCRGGNNALVYIR
jgi:hypothetical protein